MSTLYELTNQAIQLKELATTSDPEIFKDTLESLNLAIEDKADGYARVIQELQGHAQTIKNEEIRLSDMRKRTEKNIANMKLNLLDSMNATDTTKITTDLFTFSVRNNAESVVIEDEKDIPDDFYVTKREISKATLKSALKNGAEIKGVSLKRSQTLAIK
ncbi:phage related protein [Brochothrix thermosphacta]|uniref:siphovirus Gp157 family protein n=1 Tax=Brochothrix thermosphacta TaxID=2756 RepID=UPI000D7788B7|nr:siphovirus Gp157 family protein [Brochothrix thermosphacta]SPN72450.1 phage related protein [Brochothrix thermosphacta]